MELEAAEVKKAEAESQLRILEIELKTLHSSIGTLEEEVEKERNFSGKIVVKYQILENEISRMKLDSQIERSAIINEFRMNQDKELTVAATKFSECRKTIASLGRQLKSLATLEDFLIDSDSERQSANDHHTSFWNSSLCMLMVQQYISGRGGKKGSIDNLVKSNFKVNKSLQTKEPTSPRPNRRTIYTRQQLGLPCLLMTLKSLGVPSSKQPANLLPYLNCHASLSKDVASASLVYHETGEGPTRWMATQVDPMTISTNDESDLAR
ncbi:filament-like plant protein 3 [Forsythia ovata]|uniref:Filament-like plant protein 3 n=1 Tax=Forsythia ovata TaxID=205694 RepID=A0ABD1U8B8_9LAMI